MEKMLSFREEKDVECDRKGWERWKDKRNIYI